MHGDGLDAEFAAGAEDAQCDLAAVGDDDFLEHLGGARLFDDEERLAELDRVAVLRQHGDDAARLVRLDLVHHLHRFDDAEQSPDFTSEPMSTNGLAPGAGAE